MTFWVVEAYFLGKLHYWSAGATGRGHEDGWSLDIDYATKFFDSESADQVMVRLLDGVGRSTQHKYIEASERARSTPQQLAETARFMSDWAL